ncbi:MAG: TetR/AcrR family transcriptional regulator [Rhodoglobus sp.]
MTITPRMPRRDATQNHAALIIAARIELNLDPDASLEAIAARAGLSRRAVYGHFATRDELVKQVITLGAERITAALDGLHHADPVARLALIASRLWHEVSEVRVMAVFATRGALQHHTASALGPIRRLVQDTIAEGLATGAIVSEIPADLLARLVEDAALSALAQATSHRLPASTANRIVMLHALGTVGLSSTAAARLIDDNPELAWKGSR